MSTLFSHFLLKNNEIAPQEDDFTEVLESIAVTPKMLYFYGKMPQNIQKNAKKVAGKSSAKTTMRPKTLAIVGTRKPTNYGIKIARELAYEAAKRGAVVVSGMAYGIDSVAHRGALEAGGITVAVLGTPIDYIYPKSHIGLAEEIVKTGGCVMSELPAGAEFQAKTCFLQRNRIIAGLADVVVVVEAAEKSGSLNTAAHALEQGKDLFAVPGDITRLTSQGCNKLISHGAFAYTSTADVLELLFPPERKSRKLQQTQLLMGDNMYETAILYAMATGAITGEEILAETGLDAATFSQNLTMLEIKGRIVPLGCNRWAIK